MCAVCEKTFRRIRAKMHLWGSITPHLKHKKSSFNCMLIHYNLQIDMSKSIVRPAPKLMQMKSSVNCLFATINSGNNAGWISGIIQYICQDWSWYLERIDGIFVCTDWAKFATIKIWQRLRVIILMVQKVYVRECSVVIRSKNAVVN